MAPLCAALDHWDPSIRRKALSGISFELIGKTNVQEYVVEALTRRLRDEEERIRGLAAMALAGVRSDWAVRALIAAASDPVPDVRATVLSSLGRSMSIAAVPTVLAAMEDPDPCVWTVAAAALASIDQSHEALRPLRDRLFEATQTRNRKVVRSAISALAAIGGPEVEHAFRHWLRRGGVNLKSTMLHCFAQHPLPALIPEILECLLNTEWHVEMAAILALSATEQGTAHLVQLIDDGDERVRPIVRSLLASRGNELALRRLRETAENGSGQEQESARQFLARRAKTDQLQKESGA